MRALTALAVLLCASAAQVSAIPQYVIHNYAGGAAEFGVAHKLQTAALVSVYPLATPTSA